VLENPFTRLPQAYCNRIDLYVGAEIQGQEIRVKIDSVQIFEFFCPTVGGKQQVNSCG